MIQVGIIGGAGYTGGELIRLLLNHPQVELSFVQSRSQSGKALSEVHQDLLGETELQFVSEWNIQPDLLFLCLAHGDSAQFLKSHPETKASRIIDLSQDFRLDPEKVYGLPELNREVIRKADFVANPGCFATAIELALLPLAHNGMLKEVHISGTTGVTGAGVKPTEKTHYSWRDNNVSTYKEFEHQHLAEIKQTLMTYQPWFEQNLNFIPYRGNFSRGIFISAYQYCEWPLEEAIRVYEEYYEDHPFTWVSSQSVAVKQVVNTNKCFLHLQMHNGYLLIQSVIDNLLKGAAGQAVQNMNLMFGWEESSGLRLKASAF